MNLGKRIRLVRIAMELSQEQLAELIGKTRPLVSHIEQTGKINQYTLKQFCEVTGVDEESILDAREPEIPYLLGGSSIREIERLQEERDHLTTLVNGQRTVILNLKERLSRYEGNEGGYIAQD